METLLGATFVACAILTVLVAGAMFVTFVGMVMDKAHDVAIRYMIKKVIDNETRNL